PPLRGVRAAGQSRGGTLLKTLTTCYNGNTSNCTSTAVSSSITQRNVTGQFGTNGLQDLHIYKYDGSGNFSEQDDYAYASGTPTTLTRKVISTITNVGCGIFRPTLFQIQDGSGITKA